MLPPFIIEQIRRREQEEAKREQPCLELPLERSKPAPRAQEPEDAGRGVVVIDLLGEE